MSLFESDPPKPETPGRGGRRVMVMLAVLAIVAVGLGFYALHLKRKVARDEQIANEQQNNTIAQQQAQIQDLATRMAKLETMLAARR